MTLLYRFIHFMIVRLLLPLLHPFNAKVSKGYQLRQKIDGIYPWLTGPQKQHPLWIHCASGEFEYALPVIREIKKNSPQQKIMVTYFTPSYVEKIKADPLVDMVFPAPWDEPSVLREFITYHQPKALLYSRTDVWFEMSRQCHFAKIPVIVFSMTFQKKINLMLQLFLKWRWQFVDQYFVVSEEDKTNLSKLVGSSVIEVVGDSRYDQCLYRLSLNKELPVRFSSSHLKTFIAGSTWPEDEQVLMPLIQKTQNNFRWILVPHETTDSHLNTLKKQLQEFKINYVLFSQTTDWNEDSLLLVDKMGFLAELYKQSDFSFIGGSFRKQVHSVMESLACGCLTFVGPFYHNNREAIEFSSMKGSLNPVLSAKDGDALFQLIEENISLWTSAHKQHLQSLVILRCGASAHLAQKISKI
jgi:3-deoxy-D-manno-octulosonic-acid transferase